MRGEHGSYGAVCDRYGGSSPHARGTRACLNRRSWQAGIIPACAGNTTKPKAMMAGIWDHPRMRGEHSVRPVPVVAGAGSSPHARGTPKVSYMIHTPNGIIPACAGNTAGICPVPKAMRDHPRMRGEHVKVVYCPHRQMGSSPHARGTPEIMAGSSRTNGIIPACAGNTFVTEHSRRPAGDHPRMRGEHASMQLFVHEIPGSSPHARGTQGRRECEDAAGGIIPACAGNTVVPFFIFLLRVDHPRMRGEHRRINSYHRCLWGSSPHARGTPGACPK